VHDTFIGNHDWLLLVKACQPKSIMSTIPLLIVVVETVSFESLLTTCCADFLHHRVPLLYELMETILPMWLLHVHRDQKAVVWHN